MKRAIALGVAVAALSGCSNEPLHLADWVIPLPEGTRVVEYAAVATAGRTETFRTERDLVLGGAFGRDFYNPAKVAIAPDGTIFVLDAGNHRVVAFDAEGVPLLEFGREGEGPGEFANPSDLALLGDTVVVNDTSNVRFGMFARDGTHVADRTLETRLRTSAMQELEGDLLTLRWEFAEEEPDGVGPPGTDWMIARHGLTGEELSRPLELRRRPSAYIQSGTFEGSVPILAPGIFGVLGPGGVVFVTNSAEYQVLALAADGAPQWALRTDYRPVAVAAETKSQIARELREQWQPFGVELQAGDIHFPEHYTAIVSLLVDARGNLYVIPFADRAHDEFAGTLQRPVPVDVYAPDGTRVFSGMIGIETWHAARGDHVYRIETDPDTEERVVARYRLVYPFT